MQIIHYKGYAIEATGSYYKLKLYPDRVYLSLAEVREAIDKMINQ